MLFPANRLDDYLLAGLIDIIEDTMSADPHFPGGQVIGPEGLAVPILDQWLGRQPLFDGIENDVPLGLSQELEIAQGTFGEYHFERGLFTVSSSWNVECPLSLLPLSPLVPFLP
jgi:hypothetical protein